MFKNLLEKYLSREFMILCVIEVIIGLKDVSLLLDSNNIILIVSLLGLTTVKRFVDKKNQTEKVVIKSDKKSD